ncbi:MAG: cation:proton antiporter, partial [Chloroflexota bacterium]
MELSILNLLFVLLAALVAGNISTRLGYPSIFGELAAGIILGPPLLGLLHESEALEILAEVGVILMMLYIGMEIDPKELFKASWAGMLAAIGGFITPFFLTYLVVTGLGASVAAGLFVGIAAGVTSLATKSRILVDLKLLNTRIAHVLMAGALISDTLALIVFAAIIGIFDSGGLSVGDLGLVTGKAILFFAAVSFIGLRIFPPLWRRLAQAGYTGRTFNATLVLLIALLFAEFAELAGLHAILGAFLAGLFLREGTVLEPKLSHQLNDLVHDISIGFLAPIFFVTAGFHVSLDVFQSDLLVLLIAVTVVATVGKIVGTALFYLPSGYGWREGITVGAGMNGRGAVEIIIAQVGLGLGIITPEIFSVLVFMAIFTTATVPIFLKWTTEWLERRGELVRSTDERKGVLILGASPTARLLARHLSDFGPVSLVDINQYNCEMAKAEGLNAIQGDGLDEDILQDANAETMRTFIALTSNPEVNVLAGNLARDVFGISDVRVLLTHANTVLRRSAERQGFTPIDAVWEDILEWDMWIEQGEVESVDISVEKGEDIDYLFDELHSGPDALALVAERDDYPIPFPSQDVVEAGDQLVALKVKR